MPSDSPHSAGKPRPNHREYLRVLRGMPPAQRLQKAIELGELSRRLFKQGLWRRFPELSEEELHRLYLERLGKKSQSELLRLKLSI